MKHFSDYIDPENCEDLLMYCSDNAIDIRSVVFYCKSLSKIDKISWYNRKNIEKFHDLIKHTQQKLFSRRSIYETISFYEEW